TILVRECRRLKIGDRYASRTLMDKLLPGRAPSGSLSVSIHGRRFNRVALGAHMPGGSANEAETSVVMRVVGEIVHRDPLRRQTVPDVHVERKESGHAGLIMREEMPAHLAMIICQPVAISCRLRKQKQA